MLSRGLNVQHSKGDLEFESTDSSLSHLLMCCLIPCELSIQELTVSEDESVNSDESVIAFKGPRLKEIVFAHVNLRIAFGFRSLREDCLSTQGHKSFKSTCFLSVALSLTNSRLSLK